MANTFLGLWLAPSGACDQNFCTASWPHLSLQNGLRFGLFSMFSYSFLSFMVDANKPVAPCREFLVFFVAFLLLLVVRCFVQFVTRVQCQAFLEDLQEPPMASGDQKFLVQKRGNLILLLIWRVVGTNLAFKTNCKNNRSEVVSRLWVMCFFLYLAGTSHWLHWRSAHSPSPGPNSIHHPHYMQTWHVASPVRLLLFPSVCHWPKDIHVHKPGLSFDAFVWFPLTYWQWTRNWTIAKQAYPVPLESSQWNLKQKHNCQLVLNFWN